MLRPMLYGFLAYVFIFKALFYFMCYKNKIKRQDDYSLVIIFILFAFSFAIYGMSNAFMKQPISLRIAEGVTDCVLLVFSSIDTARQYSKALKDAKSERLR
jgi:hypothetical protein